MAKLRQLQPLIIKYRGVKIVMHSNGTAWIKNTRSQSGWSKAPLHIGELPAKTQRNRANVRAMIDRWWLTQATEHEFFKPCDDLPWEVHMIADRTAHAMAAQAYRAARG